MITIQLESGEQIDASIYLEHDCVMLAHHKSGKQQLIAYHIPDAEHYQYLYNLTLMNEAPELILLEEIKGRIHENDFR